MCTSARLLRNRRLPKSGVLPSSQSSPSFSACRLATMFSRLSRFTRRLIPPPPPPPPPPTRPTCTHPQLATPLIQALREPAALRMAFSFSTERGLSQTGEQVLIEEMKSSRTIILNRPHQLNAISYWMTGYLKEIYEQWEKNEEIQLVLIKGSGRAFSAGGDVAEVYRFGKEGRHDKSMHFFSQEYNVNYLVGTYKKSHVALIDGIVMGGGAGISINGNFRVVTEKTVFAMPETGLGLHPDVGASYFLSRLPGFLGEYIGLTGARLDGVELLSIGLATHYVPSERLSELEAKLKYVSSGDPAVVNGIISNFSENVVCKPDSFIHRLEEINSCFSKPTVEEILEALEQLEAKKRDDWCMTTIVTLKKASPMSLKITLRSIREGRHQTFRECLIREYRLTVRCLRAAFSNDFYEGCRAILIEKDKNPKWNPSSLVSVTSGMVDHYFSSFDKEDEELNLPGSDRLSNAAKFSSRL